MIDMTVHTDLSVCQACLLLIANAETTSGPDGMDPEAHAEFLAEAHVKLWGDRAGHLTAEGDELGFTDSLCDACGDALPGDRFTAYIP